MSQAMPPQTEEGYSPPSVRQFSVFLSNRVGKLLEVVRLFDEASNVHLVAFSVVEASDHAVVRIIPSHADAARALLRNEGLAFSECDLLVVELNEGHSLTSMCLHLLAAEINIRFAYPLMFSNRGTPTIALAVDDHTLAGQILRRKRYGLLGEGDLG
jgi:hypothetical protein